MADISRWKGFADHEWQVHKFGGTSVANAQCFQQVASIVEEKAANPDLHICVVVSAMGGKPKVTDLLLNSVEAASQRDEAGVEEALSFILDKHQACLKELCLSDKLQEQDESELLGIIRSNLNDIRDILKTVSLMKWNASRIKELVSGYGELWSSQILARLLQRRRPLTDGDVGHHTYNYMDARRIITIDEEEIKDGAVVWSTSEDKLAIAYKEETEKAVALSSPEGSKIHLVCTGYVASNTHGVATTLQRDGSDYSAAIMGRLLHATEINIWTDVSGVLSADPRRVPHAYPVPEVSYNEAMELAYFGAKVIHPKTMQPAISSNPQIPIYIKNTFEAQHPGTRIFTTSTTHTEPEKCVCGFSSIDNMALINVEGSGLIGVHGVAKRLFGTLEQVGVNVVLISQASSEHSITFSTIEDDAEMAKEAIAEEFAKELAQEKINNIDVTVGCSIIAAVGDGMHFVSGVSGRFFGALGDAQINILAISQGCSERNISAVVKQSESTRALRALHAAFRLSHTTVRLAIIGMNDVGESLLRLLEVQRPVLRKTFQVDLQVCAVAKDAIDTDIIFLQSDDSKEDGESITMSDVKSLAAPPVESSIQFEGRSSSKAIESSKSKDLKPLMDLLLRGDHGYHMIFDCTNSVSASAFHPDWLNAGIHIVTANNTGLSGPFELREAIDEAEQRFGKRSAQYLREVTVGGGLPIIGTLRQLLNSGDKIRRVDGIFSVAISYILYRISPPKSTNNEFDKELAQGVFQGDIELPTENASLDKACSFSQAVEEAIALGLTETDLQHDLSNEYTVRSLMVLAKELGLDWRVSLSEIQSKSDILSTEVNESADQRLSKRVEEARQRGCVLRHVGSVDVARQTIDLKLIEVPENHTFATAPPSCSVVRFFTSRYQPYPLVITGPAAGADCTSSALLAEALGLLNTKIGPKTGTLARTESSAYMA
ncbi:unnamed protein product [Cylindrotheca closterium]|uniref:ACT domain-containing protein n=1 Tax=Cylindrotheca closterium TaxID=2856 RepID=A0AAD2PWT8_9STRA|nr:unnamed protein product [Cylindrotheca closterium]